VPASANRRLLRSNCVFISAKFRIVFEVLLPTEKTYFKEILAEFGYKECNGKVDDIH
jgi:hypothetical protein